MAIMETGPEIEQLIAVTCADIDELLIVEYFFNACGILWQDEHVSANLPQAGCN